MIDNTVQARAADLSDEQWLDLGMRHAGRNLDGGDFLKFIKAVCRDYAALTAPAAVEGWQPIETAPSGTAASILIGTEGYPGSTGEAFWHDGSECHGHRGGAGWFWESDRAHLLTASNATGTHWCYPPTPPGAAPSAPSLEALPDGHLYRAVNNLLCHIGMEGEIDSRHPFVDAAMDALHAIDGGVYLEQLAKRAAPSATAPVVEPGAQAGSVQGGQDEFDAWRQS